MAPTAEDADEYWRIAGEIRARMPALHKNIERYEKLAEQQGPGGKARHSLLVMMEVAKRCSVERGSPEAAGKDHEITPDALRRLAVILVSLKGLTPGEEVEYWRVVREIRARMPVLRKKVERYTAMAGGKPRRSLGILTRVMKLCMMERGAVELTSLTLQHVIAVQRSLG